MPDFVKILRAKDYFTAGNIVCGIVSILLTIEGKLDWAAYVIILGWVFDSLDGRVARWTNHFNRFGAEFDNVADLITYSIAPGFLIYAHYAPTSRVLAGLLALCPPIFGAIRLARFNVQRIEYPGIHLGLPRPATAFVLVSFFSSYLYGELPFMRWLGVALVPAMGMMNVSLLPYVGHHNRRFSRSWNIVIGFVIVTFLGSIVLSLTTPYRVVFDVLFFWYGLYAFGQLLLIPQEDRKKIRDFTDQWRREEAARL